MLDLLIPVSGNHSISRVVATVFVPQVFLKPQDTFEKIKDIEAFKHYPKKIISKAATINFNKNAFGITNEQVKGFFFESYDENGSVENVFSIENIKDNKAAISLEGRKYSRWKTFKSQLITDLSNFASDNNFYIEAISLNYRDEFIWMDKASPIPVDLIFNSKSELLNKKFLSSRNGTLMLISQGTNSSDENSFEEKTEIFFNNDIKRIIIDHQYAILFNDIKLFNEINTSELFSSLYDSAHEENKKILKDILTKDIQHLINLK